MKILRLFIVLLILLLAAGGATYIIWTKPKAQRKKPAKSIPIVNIITLEKSKQSIIVKAMGTVTAVRQIELKSRVNGEIVSVNPGFEVGGFFKTGDEILQIDKNDYQLVIEQKKAQLDKAKAALKLEMGKQAVAIREWELMNLGENADELDRELALRQPQLDTTNAAISICQADLSQAKLNLERTSIVAPFDCIVLSKNVDLGSQVTTQTPMGELAATDEYWIQASIPVENLKWITIPLLKDESGSLALIKYGSGTKSMYTRSGMVNKLLGNLEVQGRMARILITVKDPLNIQNKTAENRPLLLGEFVRIEIAGKEIADIFNIPRIALRENNKVWIVSEGNLLEIREVETIWRSSRTVLIDSNLQDGEKLITSDLATPVAGLEVKIEGENEISSDRNLEDAENNIDIPVSEDANPEAE